MQLTTLGLDPSLAHGIFLKASWDIEEKSVGLAGFEVLYDWGKRKASEQPLTKDSTPADLQRFGSGLLSLTIPKLKAVDGFPVIPVAVDWDPTAIMWRGNSKSAGMVSFLAGYIIRGLQSVGLPVVVITPREVRTHFHLPPRADKKQIWNEVDFFPERTNSDVRDALILSYVMAEGEARRRG